MPTKTTKTAAANLRKTFAKTKLPAPRPSPYMVYRPKAKTSFVCTVWELKILRRALKNAMGKKKGGGCPEFATLEARIAEQLSAR